VYFPDSFFQIYYPYNYPYKFYVVITSIGTFTFLSVKIFSFSKTDNFVINIFFKDYFLSCFFTDEFLFSIIKPYIKGVLIRG